MRKRRKSNLIRIFLFYDRRKFQRQRVNVIDNVRSYLFFNVWKLQLNFDKTWAFKADANKVIVSYFSIVNRSLDNTTERLLNRFNVVLKLKENL